ncbi:MAG: tRNA adenosine(34) deaminase TadA [Firmicutes bacterium]|nr:tRNA adenosine(34) deaminase TadA [Bacillota bacterium]
MEEALLEAQAAADIAEVPVGAVVVKDGRIIGRGHNRKETGKDATLHAEMIAIRQACACLGGWRLPGAALYVTLEPCPMCAGALVQARVARLVYAAPDPKSGACGSVMNICEHPALNHRLIVEGGLEEERAALLLKQFFRQKRQSVDRYAPPAYNGFDK